MQTNNHSENRHVTDTSKVPTARNSPRTVTETAKFLCKSNRWIWSALTRGPEESGSIPHFRVGSAPRFFPADIATWVRQGCPPAATFAEWNAAEQKRQKRSG